MVDLCGFGVIFMVLKIQFVCEFRGYIYIYILNPLFCLSMPFTLIMHVNAQNTNSQTLYTLFMGPK